MQLQIELQTEANKQHDISIQLISADKRYAEKINQLEKLLAEERSRVEAELKAASEKRSQLEGFVLRDNEAVAKEIESLQNQIAKGKELEAQYRKT